MKIIKYPKKDEWSAILKRPEMNHAELFERVEEIIRKTADGGDAALRDFTKKFDGILLQDIQVDIGIIYQVIMSQYRNLNAICLVLFSFRKSTVARSAGQRLYAGRIIPQPMQIILLKMLPGKHKGTGYFG